jgi:hypothetical protein
VTDLIGWAATTLFVLSYFAKSKRTLLLLQFVAALVWLSYGVLLRATPVIAANALVAGAAAFTVFRERAEAQ